VYACGTFSNHLDQGRDRRADAQGNWDRKPAQAPRLAEVGGAACNTEKVIEVGAPKRWFYAKDLEPGIREKSQARRAASLLLA
jgi:hypothetical protein